MKDNHISPGFAALLAFLIYCFGAASVVLAEFKLQIAWPDDPFLSDPFDIGSEVPATVRWAKFTVLLDDPGTVYWQDSNEYELHYNFAVNEISGFAGLSVEEFNERTLTIEGQEAVLGGVLFNLTEGEIGIEFVGRDPYPAEYLVPLYRSVAASIVGTYLEHDFYFPTSDQRVLAIQESATYARENITVSSIDRWLTGNVVYSPGWALGFLREVPSEEIADAYADGRIGPGDILLTDRLPDEIPFLSGILTRSATTPNSHPVILARGYGVPLAFASDANLVASLEDLVNQRILLETRESGTGDFFSLSAASPTIQAIPADQRLPIELQETLIAFKVPPELDIASIAKRSAYSLEVDDLVPEDIRYAGGKAANFGFLRRAIPDNVPEAIAFTFDLWTEFLDQVLIVSGNTLRSEIDQRLAHYSWPPDIANLREDLRTIRQLFTAEAGFSEIQQTNILDALSRFDVNRKIRFRSSTNVEDSEHFSGAGLYDSFSGCILDDTDGDIVGPSRCDPGQPNERGVFRALRKVYASFYNENAFLERLRHGVDEGSVGMAVLAHHSFPDEIELANGVATLKPNGVRATLVTQAGAESVANPDGRSQPEVVEASIYSFGNSFRQEQRSSLISPEEDFVMNHPDDYDVLVGLLKVVRERIVEERPADAGATLNFEYKKIVPGKIVIKQVRKIPRAEATADSLIVFVGDSYALETMQGEGSAINAYARLKSVWNIESTSFLLDPETQSQEGCSFADVTIDFLIDGEKTTRSGKLCDWTGYRSFLDDSSYLLENVHEWSEPSFDGSILFQLRLGFIRESDFEGPVRFIFPSDLLFFFDAQYPGPRPVWGRASNYQASVTEERVSLWLKRSRNGLPEPGSFYQKRAVIGPGVRVDTGFFWPPEAIQGPNNGYTAPLLQWNATRVIGLTPEPFVLTDYFAQTYLPYHHNFGEEFLLQPHLDPNLPAQVRSDLEQSDVKLIFFYGGSDEVTVAGFDGVFRPVSADISVPFYFPDAVSLGQGWWFIQWFGILQGDSFRWIYHTSLGWMYGAGNGGDSLWVFSPTANLAWLWTSPAVFPFFWSHARQDWMYYLQDTANPNWFYDFSINQWIGVE
jgi:hypothetical protein